VNFILENNNIQWYCNLLKIPLNETSCQGNSDQVSRQAQVERHVIQRFHNERFIALTPVSLTVHDCQLQRAAKV